MPIAAADKGHCRATYGTTAYGWAKYHCHFTADFGPSDKGLAAKAAHNTDSEVDDDTASTLFRTGSGATLKLAEDIPDSARDADLPRICPRGGDFADPLFHTSIEATDAHRLTP